MFLQGYSLAKLILPLTGGPKERGFLVRIVSIKLIALIDALPISEDFDDRDALISLKCDDPEAQKWLWLHYIYGTPHQGFESWPSVNRLECSAFEQFDPHATENVISVGLTEV
jgi:hypothetical protein